MRENGFTLVELIVVIVIIGIMSAVALPKFTDAINKARLSEIPSNVALIVQSEAMYYSDKNRYAVCQWQDDNNDYANDIILEKLGLRVASQNFRYETALTAPGDNFTIIVTVAKPVANIPTGTYVIISSTQKEFSYPQNNSNTERLNNLSSYLE